MRQENPAHTQILLGYNTAFMTKFCAAFLDQDWEGKCHRELLLLKQNSHPFKDFLHTIQAKNALRKDTSSYLNEQKLRHQIEVGLNEGLDA